MIIGIFGESCTGKSTIANELTKKLNAKIYTGKDYIKLAKNEDMAKKQFVEILKSNETTNDIIIYVISEKEHLSFLPEKATRVLVTAELNLIKERFSKRLNGNLPPPIATMLEKRHGSFNNEKHDIKIENAGDGISDICDKIIALCKFGRIIQISKITNETQLNSVLDLCYNILGQHLREVESYRYADWLERLNNPNQILLYAHDNNKIVAAVLGRTENTHSLIIGFTACDKNYRLKGITKRLVKEFERLAITLRYKHITLGADKNSEVFYEKCGYKKINEVHGQSVYQKVL